MNTNKTVSSVTTAELDAFTENARKGQWICPYPNDEELVEVVIYQQSNQWHLMHEFMIYTIVPEVAAHIPAFINGDSTWRDILEKVVFPTFQSMDLETEEYVGFSIKNPVYHLYIDGIKRVVEYLEGEGIQPPEDEQST